ncbi:ATP-dependent Clp protease ATP-binding subunit [Candidatus Saccharibacteria bacterium]|jgi:ATP-dependent Clp protease ATP-binding subunit ClpC|nr:ATP-dependent Clp protease ATP-binding subunit [Candidatus Saccharibacteria bacterium]
MSRSHLFDFSPYADRLTNNAKESLIAADEIARGFGSSYIGTEHILLGVLSQNTSVAAQMLDTAGVDFERAKTALNLTPRVRIQQAEARGLSETAKLTLKMSWDIAREFNQMYCGTEHILFCLINQKNARSTVLLGDMSVDVENLKGSVESYLNNQQYEAESDTSNSKSRRRGKKRSAIDYFGIDVTKQAQNDELDPLIGREDQLLRMITILVRRTKNNPVLLGDAGVGKTAIVEGLAQKIVNDDVPEPLLDKRIISLDLTSLVAGTKYRGEFEGRLKKMMEELQDDPNIILFIDELHLIMGAGSAEGSMDVANLLKPALARGQLRVIGATTDAEYKKFIEKDSALERRFQPVNVPETSPEQTVAILKGLRKHYQNHHGVKIPEDLLPEVVRMADRYINDRQLPDKAVDLIDEGSAYVRISNGVIDAEQRDLQRSLRSVQRQMEQSVDDEDYERAALYKTRYAQLRTKLEESRAKASEKQNLKLHEDDIAEVVANMTGIPLQKIVRQEANHLLRLETHLSKNIIGQKAAVKAVSRSIRRNRSGVSDSRRPIGSFIFLGPSGVGKTELARVLARELFDDDDSLIKIDMSEFSERHTTSRLIGAPAGFVGYEEGGQLTDKVRKKPYSLLLFDEIEKAHPDVFNLLLQILEDGHLTDAKGRSVDFTNTIVIMTSNIGASSLRKESTLGFRVSKPSEKEELDSLHAEVSEKVLSDLRESMRPELLNRLDKVIVFQALTKAEAKKVLNLQLQDLSNRLNEQHLGLEVSAPARNVLLKNGYSATDGVRPLRRAIQDHIEDRLAEGVLSGEYNRGDVVSISAKKGKLEFSVSAE